MSQYNWSKRYEIPEVRFKTLKNSYQSKGYDNKLRQTIQVSSLNYDDLNIRNNRTKPRFPVTQRHTTDSNTSLSDLLGKSYKFFEPRAAKQKTQSGKISMNLDYSLALDKKYSKYQASSNLTWTESRFKSSKDFKQVQTQSNVSSDRDKFYNSSRHIPQPLKQDLRSPSRTEQQTQPDSPYTFMKRNKFCYTTPQSNKQQQADQISTKFESPVNTCDHSVKLLEIEQTKTELKYPKLENFVILKHLGEGRFGAVSMAIHKQSRLLVALKRVKKEVIKAHKLQNQFIMEMKMQLFFNHPNILKIYGYFDDSENIYLILELMQEGTLFSKLKKAKKLEQKEVSQKMQDVLHAIKYMHDLQIVHRDIKPQNIVLSNGVCKVCDFGWAAICQNRRTTLCGTIDYAPPEVLQGKQYGITMDLWCLGVLCYELLVGKAPFYHVSKKQTMQKIIKADSNDLKLPSQLSKESVDFITKMLIKDAQERMHAEQALSHRFIQMNLDKQDQKLRCKNK